MTRNALRALWLAVGLAAVGCGPVDAGDTNTDAASDELWMSQVGALTPLSDDQCLYTERKELVVLPADGETVLISTSKTKEVLVNGVPCLDKPATTTGGAATAIKTTDLSSLVVSAWGPPPTPARGIRLFLDLSGDLLIKGTATVPSMIVQLADVPTNVVSVRMTSKSDTVSMLGYGQSWGAIVSMGLVATNGSKVATTPRLDLDLRHPKHLSFVLGASADTFDASGALNTIPLMVFGGEGDDAITTGPGDDTLDGGPGNDTLDGQGGCDTFSGGAGDDFNFDDGSAARSVGIEGDFSFGKAACIPAPF